MRVLVPGGNYLAEAYRRAFGYAMEGRHEACDLCGSWDSVVVGRFDRWLRPLTNVMCTRCGLIRQDPMPTEAELIRLYEREYRTRQKGAVEPTPRDVDRSLYRSARRLARLKHLLPPGAKILDVGSGAGDFAYLASQAGFRVRAVEPNIGYAEWSKRTYGIDVTVGTWETIEVTPGSYDFISAHHVLEHLRSPFAALKKFHEWLKPDGLLWFGVPDLSDPNTSPINRFPVWHVYGFTPETHQMMALKAGFSRFPGASKTHTLAVLRRLPAPAEDWFIYPDHAQQMQEFFRDNTFLRHLLRGRAYKRLVERLSGSLRGRLKRVAPAPAEPRKLPAEAAAASTGDDR